jgi:SAM-dependent methyltransferase
MKNWTNNFNSGMSYQQFSVDPLKPLTPESESRIVQLKNDLICVNGRSVLDIGCFAGLASVLSLELGASSVISVDVDPTYLDNIQSWASEANRPLVTSNSDFISLNNAHKADVVIFMEVYHWLAHQGLSENFIANKLNELAQTHIYIETPFDAWDPSIQRSMECRLHLYRIDLVLNMLINFGWRIEFLGMANYFPADYRRARFIASK